jgi:hypothetical protein
VPAQQQRFDASSVRQASFMTGANPVSPSRESYRASDRSVNPSSIPSRSTFNQRYFGGNSRTSGAVGATGQTGFNRSGSDAGASSGPVRSAKGNPQGNPRTNNVQGQRTLNSSPSQQNSGGWRSFNGQSEVRANGGARTYEQQGSAQPRNYGNAQPGNSQPRSYGNYESQRPGYSQSEPSRQYQPYSRGAAPNTTYSRPTLNMQQPVVTPRGGYSAPAQRGAPSGGSYGSSRPSGGGSYSRGGSRGGSSGGGSHGGSSGGHASGGRR